MHEKRRLDKDADAKVDRIISKDYLLIIVASLGGTFMNQFFHAAIPLYVQRLGGVQLQAGTMTTAFALAALVTRPVSGILSDKYGRVVQIAIGAVICSVACALFGIVGVFPLLLVARALSGAGYGMYSTCTGAAAADVLPKSRMAEGLGYYGLYTTVSLAIAPGIALYIIRGDEIGDFQTLFFLTAAACFICAIVSRFITYERKRKKAAIRDGQDGQDSQDGKDGNRPDLGAAVVSDALPQDKSAPLPKSIFGFEFAVFAPMLVIILVYGGNAGLTAFMTPFAKWKGIDNAGLYFTSNAIGVFASRMIFGRVADKRGFDIVIIPAIALLAIYLVILPFVDSLIALVAIAFPIGISMGSIMTSINAMIINRCSTARRGTASGAYFSAMDLGWAIGTPLLGALADMRGYAFMYRFGAVSVSLALVFYLLVCSDRRFNARRAKKVFNHVG